MGAGPSQQSISTGGKGGYQPQQPQGMSGGKGGYQPQQPQAQVPQAHHMGMSNPYGSFSELNLPGMPQQPQQPTPMPQSPTTPEEMAWTRYSQTANFNPTLTPEQSAQNKQNWIDNYKTTAQYTQDVQDFNRQNAVNAQPTGQTGLSSGLGSVPSMPLAAVEPQQSPVQAQRSMDMAYRGPVITPDQQMMDAQRRQQQAFSMQNAVNQANQFRPQPVRPQSFGGKGGYQMQPQPRPQSQFSSGKGGYAQPQSYYQPRISDTLRGKGI